MSSDSLWATCGTCGKQISVKAASCPHCGAGRSRLRVWKWIGGGLLAIIVVGAFAGPHKPTTGDGEIQAPSAKVNAPIIPDQQNAFLSVIADNRTRFRSASNELQQSALRDARRLSLSKLFGSQLRVDGWRGTVRRLETNGDGKAIVAVRLAPDLDILTWNNSLSDIVHSTMIEKSTPLYAALMNMSIGDSVIVSGNFLPSDYDGILETSLTIKGAMTAPEFLFLFKSISKQ